MKQTIRRSALLSLTAASILAAACAPMTEAQREAWVYARVEFKNKFIEDRAQCHASGRRMHIQAWGGGVDRNGIPKSRVPYVCL